MRKEINIDTWNRKDHFEFFSQFDEPFHGIATKLDCTETYKAAKANGHSFFLSYLHKSLVAVNRTLEFRYRIVDGKLYEYETINASPTINKKNGAFGFSHVKYREDFKDFLALALPAIEKVRNSDRLMPPEESGENVVHCSAIPWVDFTSISHARHYARPDSCPKITFGKMTADGDRLFMPVSVHVHHALVDGYHVAQFLEKFQNLMLE
ncbi:chloramphenicol acetyltransferase [Zobellia galactanivorans]|uniref:chloramphenicol acetyltransferase n=1 Tax=Zobellia galactanivorans (strain DSM 12802 / CCUG 47099 / CIP 106680 / NCIMB 13871 / Dsij) TaxID=63186 RepID=UPI001C076BEA|nr:chloramphenicol acetyltransferase [Zobellia galactanivorans]MBU3026444.1 chloramphenicol acetyltransferase [Zobellia galactanivorans]